jgi:phosphotransferase system enzyme I (PtsI)
LTTVKPEKVFQGNGVSPGMVLGQALKLDSHNRVILRISVTDVEEEVRRLEHAVAASKEQLEVLKQCLEEKVGREHSFMLDVHILMLEDNSLMREILTLIRKRHVRPNGQCARLRIGFCRLMKLSKTSSSENGGAT